MKSATLILLAAMLTAGSPGIHGGEAEPADSSIALTYEIEDRNEQADISAVAKALQQRLERLGFAKSTVNATGAQQVRVTIPTLPRDELDQLKRTLMLPGELRLRLVANSTDHKLEIELAKAQPQVDRFVLDADRKPVAIWADVTLDPKHGEGLRVDVSGCTIRCPKTKKFLAPPPEIDDFDQQLTKWLKKEGCVDALGRPQVQVLIWTADGYDVAGRHFSKLTRMADDRGLPAIAFSMTAKGGRLIAGLTGDHLPEDSGHTRRLGILLDDELLSAPFIRGQVGASGQITGNFSDSEVDRLIDVLRFGSLPTKLKLVSESGAERSVDAGGAIDE